uniref:Uncharacterized protein n=1 Tax=Panagrolaimus sp. ES5 TaxID=591445 RepID=A0AC34GG24_9BILA
MFKTDPEERHCCVGEKLEKIYGDEVFKDVADELKNTGMSERQRLKKVENHCLEKYGSETGLKPETPPGDCEPGNIDAELQQSLFNNGSIVKIHVGGEKPYVLLFDDNPTALRNLLLKLWKNW